MVKAKLGIPCNFNSFIAFYEALRGKKPQYTLHCLHMYILKLSDCVLTIKLAVESAKKN